MKRTDEQDAYIQEFKKGEEIVLRARAGCGKTTTNILLAKDNPNTSMYFAVFNKKNEVEMLPKLPQNCKGSTWHLFGLSNFPLRLNLDPYKVNNIIKEKYDPFKEKDKKAREKLQYKLEGIFELVSLLKNHSEHPTIEDANELIQHHGVNCDEPEYCLKVLDRSDRDPMRIDFDDMLRYPLIKGWIKPRFDAFIGDESQDNTPIRTLILKKLQELGVQVATVGDDKQSIYGFAGADCKSMDNIEKILGATVMPLTINFRCGNKIIEEAQKIVPDIRAQESAIDGVVENIMHNNVPDLIKDGDCVVARRNRDIVAMCFKLIRNGKNATIQGVDFGSQMIRLVKSFKARNIEEFRSKITTWKENKLAKGNNTYIEDQFETLKFFSDNANTVESIVSMINKIFSDDQSPIKLITAHKSKGLEFERVFVLNSNKFGIPNQTGWKQEQEDNCLYVALTRAKSYLGLVN